MHILVVGAGSTGCFYGHRFALAGFDVTFVARGAAAAVLGERGVVVELGPPPPSTIERSGPYRVVPAVAQCPDVDLIFVAVKAGDLASIAGELGACWRGAVRRPRVMTIINGLDAEVELAVHWPVDSIVGAVAYVSAGRIEAGRVYCRQGGDLVLAPMPGQPFAPVTDLARTLRAALPVDANPSLALIRWKKLLWNGPLSALSAIHNKMAGEVLDDPTLGPLALVAMRELVRVANAEGVSLGEEDIQSVVSLTRGKAYTTECSMLQDVRAGRPTEAMAIQGAVVRAAARHGINAPVHAQFLAALSAPDR
jgi:2-dehydropantoate 2-reductase